MMASLLQMMGFGLPRSKADQAEVVQAPVVAGKPAAPTRKAAAARSDSAVASVKTKPSAKKAGAHAVSSPAQAGTAEKAGKDSKPVKPVVVAESAESAQPAVAAAVAAKPVALTKPAATPKSSAVTKPAASKAPAKLPAKADAQSVSVPASMEPVAVSAAASLSPAGKPPAAPRAARGSRLAQLTVPSMAQAVASTAAKASYKQTMSTPTVNAPNQQALKKDPKLANNWKTKPLAELTDAEVLAMADDLYMNDVQMAFFRLKLVRLKQDILNSAGETTEHLREDTVIVPDPADRATIEEEHALELRTRDRERKLLKKIAQSLGRLENGDYGFCDETGEPIGLARLMARPTATLSLEAQQRRELKQKMFGD